MNGMRSMRQTKQFMDKIKAFQQDNLGISIRNISAAGKEIAILYIPQLTDRAMLSHNMIRPILEYDKDEPLTINRMAASVISIDDISIDHNVDKILDYICKGNAILFMTDDKHYIVANTLKIEKRNIESPEIQNSLRAPRDAFTENLEANLSLIRYRIKDTALRIDHYTLGRRTKTDVAVIYIHDIANPKYVNAVKKELQKIHIDGILESGYIQKFIQSNTSKLFPQIGIIERSDAACASILKGKICIIVEGSNLALVMPKTLIEFLDSGDDHYDNLYLAIFTKYLRVLGLVISLTLSSLYVAVVSFHPDILPPQYILALATSRVTVPVNAFLEATLMEIVAEMLREASIRLPKQIGPAIGIVGTIVIGQAAVAAGLVSPLMVIIISLATMSSFASPDYTIMNPIRILKFVMLIITGGFGLFGFMMGFIFITIHLISLTSFDVPYVAPIAPFNLKDLKDYIFSDITLSKKRPGFLNTRDKTRQ